MMSCSHPLLRGVSLDNIYKIIRNKLKHPERWIKNKRMLFLKKYVLPNSCTAMGLVWITYININTQCFPVRNHKMRQTTVKEPVKPQPFYSDLIYKIMKIKLLLCLAACRSRPYLKTKQTKKRKWRYLCHNLNKDVSCNSCRSIHTKCDQQDLS